MRVLDAEWKRESYERSKKGLCRWCGLDVKRLSTKRRTFCSDECVHEYMLRSSTAYMRKQVYKRDRGVCAKCGLNASKWYSEFKRWLRDLPYMMSREERAQAVHDLFVSQGMEPVPDWAHRSTWWDADHIVEVVNGGGQCGLDNMQTLCVGCHRTKTADLNRTRKRK